MRKLALSLGLVSALAISGAVMAQDDLSGVDPSGQSVLYWHQFSGAQGDTIAALIEEFNSTNEWGITVEGTRPGSYNDIREQFNGAITSGELPALVAAYANDAASYASDGAVVDINTYVNDATYGLSEEELANFNTALFDFDTVDGELLVFPHQLSAQFFLYNESLLERMGLEVPTSVEAFKEVACTVAEATGPNGEDMQGYPLTTDASAFESWVAAHGGTIWDGEAFTFAGNEAVLSALALYKELYDNGCGYIPAEAFAEQSDFALGLNPFIVSSSAGYTFVIAAFEDAGSSDVWVPTVFPYAAETPSLQVFLPGIALVAGTPEQELASWLFLKFLVQESSAVTWSGGTGYFNPVTSTVDLLTEETVTFPGLFPYFNASNTWLNSEGVRLYSSPSVAAYGTVRGLLSEALANVTSNGLSVEETVEILQEGADAALDG